jgi:diamine N-acetyltransferase
MKTLSNLVVRFAGKEDIPTIQQIAYNTWPATFGEILSEEQIQFMLNMMYGTASLEEQFTTKGHRFLLVFDNETPIGFSSFEHLSNSGKTKLHKLYVLPQAQGKGSGKMLLNAVISEALQISHHTLSLNVNKYNPAVEFYKQLNFKIVREEVIPIGKGYVMDDFVMEKKLE